MEKERIIKVDEIPKGSRLERYRRELPSMQKNTKEQILSYLKVIFEECLDFVKHNTRVDSVPAFTLRFVHDRKHYEEIESEHEKHSIIEEEAKLPSTAFVVHNKFAATVYVNLEYLMEVPNLESLLINLVGAYVHEILHALGKRDKQKTHDIQIHLVEKFLGIKFPEEAKKLKASDYYTKKS